MTSAADATTGVCPGAATCTLRRAIEIVNADTSAGTAVVVFNPTIFPAGAPATIAVQGAPLPAISRPNVNFDASNAGVRIDGGALPVAPAADGLRFSGASATIQGLSVHHFSGACLALRGDSAIVGGAAALNRANTVGGCDVGIAAGGAGTIIGGNHIGFLPGTAGAAALRIGVLVTSANVSVGVMAEGSPGNVIGNAGVAVAVGEGNGATFGGVIVARNTIGRGIDASPAPVGAGVGISPPAAGVSVLSNTIANTALAGIRVTDANGLSSTRNRFSGNRFEAIGTLSIDLLGDGIRNPNDTGDTDTGPNDLLNFPTLARATRARISGTAGPACGGCTIELYLASHLPGGERDYGATPVPGAVLLADDQGNFAFDTPAVATGQWVTAIAIEATGNTSEFGPSVRVGAGSLQCGATALTTGWNHAGFFGTEPTFLGSIFPPEAAAPNRVAAIYALNDGTAGFRRWLAAAGAGQTLDSLEPAEAYWFLADAPVTVAGGFTLSSAVPVALKAGWNDFVYIGAPGDVRDALASVAGKYSGVFHFVGGGSDGGRWAAFGAADTPDWARGFTQVEACQVYQVFMTGDAVLQPLQP